MSKNEVVTRGLSVIENVMEELHLLISEFGLNILQSVIVNVTELIKDDYAEDVTKFRVITSKVGFIIDHMYCPPTNLGPDAKTSYNLIIFTDNKISGLEQVNLSDTIGLLDVDLTNFKYLSKCTFHFNRLYNTDQFNMIPSIRHSYTIRN